MTTHWRVTKRLSTVSGVLVLCVLAVALPMAVRAQAISERPNRGLVEVITGGVEGTSIRIAEDLANLLDDGATRRVLPVVGKGALQATAALTSVFQPPANCRST